MPNRSKSLFILCLGIVALTLAASLAFATKPWNPGTLLRTSLHLGAGLETQILLRDWLAIFLWSTAALNLALVLSLLATVPFWARPCPPNEFPLAPNDHLSQSNPPTFFNPSKRTFILGALVIVLLAGFMAAPRLSQSFWGDEDYTMRVHLHGFFQRTTDPDHFENVGMRSYFRPLPWLDTLWGYKITNNHFLYTILGRLSLSSWQKITGTDQWIIREDILRLFPFLFGLAGLALWMLLVRRFGSPNLALLTGLLLALHPWFIRYISEARGYGLSFFFLPLTLWLAIKTVETGRWRWWLLYGLSQFLLLYAYPGTAFHVLGFNLILALALWKWLDPGPHRLTQLARWTVTNLLAFMAIAQLVTPCIPQVIPFLSEEPPDIPLSARWHLDLLGEFTTGMHWVHNEPHGDNPYYITVQGLGKIIPFVPHATIVALAALALLGAISFARKNKAAALLTLGLVVPSLLMHLYAFLTQKYIFQWYYVHLLPPFALFLASGMIAAATFIDRRLARSAPSLITPITLAVLLTAFIVLTQPKRNVLRNLSVDPMRESVLLTRPSIDPTHPDHIKVITGHLHYSPRIYDAHGFEIFEEKVDDHRTDLERNVYPSLPRLMRWSDQLQLPLYINVAFPSDAEKDYPATIKLLRNEEWFEKIHDVWGLEPQFDRFIYRYRGGLWPAPPEPSPNNPLPPERPSA
ncbi:MAG: glycosyltransferase family 39 protein [Verrucomicrobiota bacterium]